MGSSQSKPGSWRGVTLPPKLAFGTLCGVGPGGVPAYSSDYWQGGWRFMTSLSSSVSMSSCGVTDGTGGEHEDGMSHEYTGFKWQCVEYARRWLLVNYGITFDSVNYAYNIMELAGFDEIVFDDTLPPPPPKQSSSSGCGSGRKKAQDPPPRKTQGVHTIKVRNGDQIVGKADHALKKGSILLWENAGFFKGTGHVAVVASVSASGEVIRVAEQNVYQAHWPEGADYARELRVITGPDGSVTVMDVFPDSPVLGWVNVTQAEEDRLLQQQDARRRRRAAGNPMSPTEQSSPIGGGAATPGGAGG